MDRRSAVEREGQTVCTYQWVYIHISLSHPAWPAASPRAGRTNGCDGLRLSPRLSLSLSLPLVPFGPFSASLLNPPPTSPRLQFHNPIPYSHPLPPAIARPDPPAVSHIRDVPHGSPGPARLAIRSSVLPNHTVEPLLPSSPVSSLPASSPCC